MLRPSLVSPGQRLRDRLNQGPLLLPGVFNGISALAATRAGAEGLYISGAGVNNATLGLPDIALLSLDELAKSASTICNLVSVPVISDADTGFGSTLNTARTVIEMERAGLAGIHIEDQESPKRCGHLDGKSLIAPSEMAKKVRAAVESRRDSSFFIIARTDARGVEGLDKAIERAKLYVDHGADCIFPEGLSSEAEFEAFRSAISAPLLANMTEFGKTPIIPFGRFSELGYNIVIYPQTAFRVMLKAISEAYGELLSEGSQAGLLDRMRNRAELYDLIEYARYEAKDSEWAQTVGQDGA